MRVPVEDKMTREQEYERLHVLHTAIKEREFGGTDGFKYLPVIEAAMDRVRSEESPRYLILYRWHTRSRQNERWTIVGNGAYSYPTYEEADEFRRRLIADLTLETDADLVIVEVLQ
jgi:hypothetical protein